MKYAALRACLSSNGLEEVSDGIWLYWGHDGPYLYTCEPDAAGELDGGDAVANLWMQLPSCETRDRIGECIEKLFDDDC